MNYKEQLLALAKEKPFASTAKLAYEILLGEIMNGNLACGTPIKQSQISDDFGLSRTPVRDAINTLVEDGYIERSESGGLRVYVLNSKDYTELLQFRTQLETLAVGLASLHLTKSDLAALNESQEKLKTAADKLDIETALEADEQFHVSLVHASRNSYVTHAYAEVIDKIRFYRRIISSKQNWFSTYRLHQSIIDAIVHRNAEEGIDLIKKHLNISKEVAFLFY